MWRSHSTGTSVQCPPQGTSVVSAGVLPGVSPSASLVLWSSVTSPVCVPNHEREGQGISG